MEGEPLARLMAGRVHATVAEPLARPRAAVVFDTGPGGAATVLVRGTAVQLVPRAVNRPDAVIRTDEDTLGEMAAGALSGVQAFIEHRLTVRGNLSLALQTESVLDAPRPPRFPRFGVVGARGRRTPYLEAGPPDGPPLLMLHGLGATNASLLPLIAELAGEYRVIAPDLPGFGGSDAPLASYDPAFFANWVDGLLAQLRIDHAVVLGNSLGGRISLEVALALPHRVRALVLLTPALAFRKLRQLVPAVTLVRPELALLPMAVPRWLVDGQMRSLFVRPQVLPDTWYDAAVDEYCRVMRSPAHRLAFFAALRNIYLEAPFGEGGFWSRLPSLGIPSLFVWGAHDRLVPAAFARHVTRAVPTARSVILPECGHVPQYERPAHTAEVVRDFLDREVTGRRARRTSV
jgi:pimeloyl-ACP methyl ester carboxylesterase